MHHDFLRQIPMFVDLPDDDLARLSERAGDVEIEAGATLFHEGDHGDAVYIIVDGEFDVLQRIEGRMKLVDKRIRGDVIGEMAPLINEARKATLRARSPAKVLKIDSADFADVLRRSSTAAMAILRTVALRMRDMQSELSLHQRMAALGTLSAGLAHELNNPSAALRRAAGQLGEAFERWQSLAAEMGSLTLTGEEREIIDGLLATAGAQSRDARSLDPLERADREETIERWIERFSVERPWELAGAMVDAGLDEADLAPLESAASEDHMPTVLWWLACGGVIAGLLAELTASAGGISDIVAAVKAYTHLDQAAVQEIDVHVGIEQTLMILRYELRQVRVRREYAPDLPPISARAGELNQVWTNLITNAVDAMEGTGELTIRTRHEGDRVVVEIEDSGPGIPPEVRPRLFDPFFTTKGPGRGTGLGLHISYNIVTQKHHGDISATSQPGRTTFEVNLPIDHPA